MQIGAATVEINSEVPEKLKNQTVILLLGIYAKKPEILIQKYVCSSVFTEAIFTIANI